METLAAWPEARILDAMRAWRHGCGPLLPWFRATPFAAANHYRDRGLPVAPPAAPPVAVERLLYALPEPARAALWIFDVPAPHALWLVLGLRRRWGLAAAFPWNGWYDPEGVLDGRAEIPLLLALSPRLRRAGRASGSCLVFDSERQRATDATAMRLDNRYALGDEDAPSVAELRAAGWRRVRVYAAGGLAPDLAGYLDDLRTELPVSVATHAVEQDARG